MEEQNRSERIEERITEEMLAASLPIGIRKEEIRPSNLPIFDSIRFQLNKAIELALLLRNNITLTPIIRKIERAERDINSVINYAKFIGENSPPTKPRYWVFDKDSAKEVNHDEFVAITGHDPLTEQEEIDEELPIAPEVTE